MTTPIHGIIPARYASSRFPGKPLADIAGKPMIWHVYQRASQCGLLRSLTLATDDARIRDVAERLGMACVMTAADHPSGTDRVYEAARTLGLEDDAVVINIQGDEPLLDPAMLEELTAPFLESPDMPGILSTADCARHELKTERVSYDTLTGLHGVSGALNPTGIAAPVEVTTLAMPVDAARAASPNQVKVVTDARGNALYFSRSLIPHVRDETPVSQPGSSPDARPGSHTDTQLCSQTYLGHIGLYAFRMCALARFVSLPPSRLEGLEKLEQLRLLENGIPIRVVRTARHSPGVDTPEDLERIKHLIATAPTDKA